MALERDYELAEYLSTVRDGKQRQILTRFRLSDHKLEIEKGRLKKSWQPKENRVCGHCSTGEVETEMHFLLQCKTFNDIRNIYFNKFNSVISHFKELNDHSKLKILPGDGDRADLAVQYISTRHTLRHRLYCIYVINI